MTHKCFKLDVQKLLNIRKNSDNEVDIYIDEKVIDEFSKIMKKQKYINKLRVIMGQIFTGEYNNDLYGKEEVSNKAKHITAMKFKNSHFNNLRIYCKEFFIENKKIVMIKFFNKKSQKNDKKIKTILENIGGYEYDFKEED